MRALFHDFKSFLLFAPSCFVAYRYSSPVVDKTERGIA